MTPGKRPRVGIDFGTSSSALALVDAAGQVRFAQLPTLGTPGPSWRTLLFFDPEEQPRGQAIQYSAGGEAIAAYLERMGEGRLMQSFKTHLTTESLGRTQVAQHTIGLDDMIALYLQRLRERAEQHLGVAIEAATIGRPVRFAGGTTPADDALAAERLLAAARVAGFHDAQLELEPVAAAHHYERTLKRPELALVADFGAGTTDFCLMRMGPTGQGDARAREIVGTGGVGAAGDDLDAALIEHLVCPALGKGSTYVEMGVERPIPGAYYYKLARWHHLPFLAGARVRAELERLRRGARHPDRIEKLMHIIETNGAFHLHKAVERTKVELSHKSQAKFDFSDGEIEIHAAVTRRDFERWIEPVTTSIASCLDETLASAGVTAGDVDCVFMTGGTAFVPVVRALFEARFGAAKLRSGDELMSIASGLALCAAG
ncbi:Hsp70 family protein [Nannocystis bainbridge]|uniref:Hsp70 family protein n=1 Tax=Nannocystis bainbridge TaxID=2995303 RepID=A0ABT5E717_9BACT|nr:Hsp70 family protein [Nannocystis bainbridge]MDC0721661.1 Hsp70 family protein [Nannocystis bainbridge]